MKARIHYLTMDSKSRYVLLCGMKRKRGTWYCGIRRKEATCKRCISRQKLANASKMEAKEEKA